MSKEKVIEFAKKCFEKHKATFIQINEYTQEIEWGEPGTSSYYIRYLLNGNRVFVCGDVGDAVYSLTERADIKKIGETYDLSYFTGKLTASEHGKYNFDGSTAAERIAYNKKCAIEDCDEDKLDDEVRRAYNTFFDLARECTSLEEWHYGIRENEEYAMLIDEDWWEWMPGAGNELRQSVVMYWVGLKMAAKQLGHKVKYLD